MDEIELDALRITYQRVGEGPPVVLLHGFFGDSRVWRWQLEALSDEFTVVAWDAPGCGGSSDPPAGFRMGDYADSLAGFIRALGLDGASVVGVSFGGTLALELALRHPSIPVALVAAGAYAGWSGSLPPEVVDARRRQSLLDLQLPGDQVAAKWMPGFLTDAAPPELVREVAGIVSDFHPAGMAVMVQALAEADLRDRLPRLDVPTLLLSGGRDVRASVAVANDLHDRIRGSRLVVIPGAPHLSNVEAPERFNDEVRSFLESTPGSPTTFGI